MSMHPELIPWQEIQGDSSTAPKGQAAVHGDLRLWPWWFWGRPPPLCRLSVGGHTSGPHTSLGALQPAILDATESILKENNTGVEVLHQQRCATGKEHYINNCFNKLFWYNGQRDILRRSWFRKLTIQYNMYVQCRWFSGTINLYKVGKLHGWEFHFSKTFVCIILQTHTGRYTKNNCCKICNAK